MSRNQSTSLFSQSPPAIISRGFASLRRAHQRISTSPPSSDSLSTRSLDSTEQRRPFIRLVPQVGLSGRSFVFDVVERELEPGVVYKIGRCLENDESVDNFSFQSKVVSRNHAEIWTENEKVYIRDIGSSSGTFINHLRLCAPNHTSPPHQLRDHDVIQLGIDFQGGLEPVYRAVRIRFELNRPSQRQQNPYTQEAFQQLRQNLFPSLAPEETSLKRELTKTNTENCSESPCQLPLSDQVNRHNTLSRADIQECCICLYAIAPSQALFLAPCSHLFHFKCLGPILFNNYPGFSCPLCRGYSDLEASVAVEVDEVLEALNQANEQKSMPKDISIDTIPELEEEKTTSTHTCSGSTSEKERNSEALVPSCTEFSLIQ